MRRLFSLVAVGTFAVTASANAVELAITHFGVGLYGVPYAIAKQKGWFKDSGIDVTGFLTSAGGGTTVRNVLASELPYGEVALSAAIAAIQQGLDVKIVHAGVVSLADQVWVTRKDDTSINTVADLKGKKLGYSSPKSVTDMVTTIMLNDNKLTGQVERKALGAVGAGLTVLREKGVDLFYVTEPAWSAEKANYRQVFNSADWVPRATQTVGVAKSDWIKANGDKLKALIAARRKGVEFIKSNPDEAAQIVASEYKIPLEQAKSALATVKDVPNGYWSRGEFDKEGMDALLQGLRLVQAIEPGDFDWRRVVDESALPADLPKSFK
ncbi:MAG: Nitrate transporter substrate-binding protein [Rhodospirillales bacterium]|jgi:NitT/TauT family transport system substrate-binding protein|nr:Nitrate transporter substrate-binding protein [Rhodospirillales bacterium]